MAGSVEGLLVYQKSLAAASAISAIIERPAFRRYPTLRAQLADSSGGVPAHIREGYGQKTDRHFAHYLFIARGEAQEVAAHLAVAQSRDCITPDELTAYTGQFEEITKMLGGLIRHLHRENRKLRV